MNRRTENVPVLEDHRSEIAADPDRDRLLLDLEGGVQHDLFLHLGSGVQGVVRGRKRGHDLIAHGLDDRTVILFGGSAHHLDADPHHVTGTQISKQFIELGAADDVGEYDGKFDFLSHCAGELYLTCNPAFRPFYRSSPF